ncbi:lipopolysaccharide biosynthesis protein [Ruegeria marina]|uniref:Membrane protein involved in the export of O-antigen and teichoic acid n=1 Tax=Ruegeria marina TaxID=639004 RepID=A0A1G6VLC9_9RHOB|nr:hypothetical protein [Ruegeria marina]SDD54331.1 Membrane protein involved in the export of O-antigen and teichoic acid [Ruegeria marina]
MSDADKGLMRRTSLVTMGRIALLAVWFVMIAMVYRTIGQQNDALIQAGVLAFSLAAVKMLTTSLSDPLDLDVVRRVPVVLGTDPAKAVAIWRAAQQFRIALAGIIVLLAIALARPIATVLLHDADWAPAVMLVGAAAGLELVFRGYLSDYQSRERFGGFLALEAGLQGVRVALILALILGGWLSVLTFLGAYALATFLVVCIAYLVSGAARRALWVVVGSVSRETWQYARWIAPAMILSAVVERLDLYLLTWLRGPQESGLYGALLPLILVPEVAIGFAIGVLQPRIADLHSRGRLPSFWLSICRLTVPLAAVGLIVVWLLAEQIILLTIGPSYLDAAPAFRILFAAVMLWFSVVPVALAFVVMNMPRITLAITLGQAAVMLTAGLALIPSDGVVGAATAILVMRFVTGTMICAVALRTLNSRSRSGQVPP